MQTTANLWDVLCRDLAEMRDSAPSEKHREAAAKFRDAARQVFRPESPRLCDALEISGDVCQASGFLDDAARDFEEALNRNVWSQRHSAAARVAAKLAVLLDHSGASDKAAAHYRKALELYDAAHDPSQHCMLLNNLAALEKRTGRLDQAVKTYGEAVEAARKLHGEIHPEVAVASNNLGVALTEHRDWTAAEHAHMRALGIREKLFGAMHPDVAQSLANLAVLYHMSGNAQKADSFYRAATKTYLAFLPEDDPAIASVRKNHESLKTVKT